MNCFNRMIYFLVGYDVCFLFGMLYVMSKNNEKVVLQGDVIQDQVEDVVCILLCWVGEDLFCEGLLDIFCCVVEVYGDWFSGYCDDLCVYMECIFEEVVGYDEFIVLCDIEYESYCEYYMVLIIGCVYVGYLLVGKVVGISKLVCVVEVYVCCFQVQEKMIVQIVQCIQDVLQLIGVGVVVEGVYECMIIRGIYKCGVSMVIFKMLGSFCDDVCICVEFLCFIEVGGKC